MQQKRQSKNCRLGNDSVIEVQVSSITGLRYCQDLKVRLPLQIGQLIHTLTVGACICQMWLHVPKHNSKCMGYGPVRLHIVFECDF